MYFSTYMPCRLDMPPCGRLSRLALLGPCGLVGRGRLAAGSCRAFSEPRAQRPNHPARDRAQPAGAGASAWRGVQGVCGLTWHEGAGRHCTFPALSRTDNYGIGGVFYTRKGSFLYKIDHGISWDMSISWHIMLYHDVSCCIM